MVTNKYFYTCYTIPKLHAMKTKILLLLLFQPLIAFTQSDVDRILRGSEIILSGLTIFKVARSETRKNSTSVERLCIRNRLLQKITFRIAGFDQQQNEVLKELVVQKNGKECLFELPKGIYTYEVLLASNETYKKGEYKFEDITTFVVRDP